MELAPLAELIADDLGLDDPKLIENEDLAALARTARRKVHSRLAHFAVAHGWKVLREEFRERQAAAIEVKLNDEAVDVYLAQVRHVGDSLMAQGMIHAQHMAPMTMPEALDMVRTGVQLGLRGRNLPERISSVTRARVDFHLEKKLVDEVQALPPGEYEALANSVTAAFVEPVAGFAAADGDSDDRGTGE